MGEKENKCLESEYWPFDLVVASEYLLHFAVSSSLPYLVLFCVSGLCTELGV